MFIKLNLKISDFRIIDAVTLKFYKQGYSITALEGQLFSSKHSSGIVIFLQQKKVI